MALNLFFNCPNLTDDTGFVMQSPPRTHSVVGRSGEFILFQFCNSSLYLQIQEYYAKCMTLCQKMIVGTGEKYVLHWLSDLLLFVEVLSSKFRHSISHKLTIGYDDCQESIASAADLLMDIPDDVISTLASYNVGISVKQPSGKVTLNVSNTSVSSSVGCYALRWMIFFYNALVAYLMATDGWNASVKKIAAYFYISNSPQKRKEYKKKINDLLDDMNEKLVVMPIATTINDAIAIHKSEDRTVDGWIPDDTFTIDKFENDEYIISNRFEILDNLLNRKANARGDKIYDNAWVNIYENGSAYESSEISSNEIVRFKSRSLFESSFIKAVENIGIHLDSESSRDIFSMCSFLAWDLETIVYDKLVGESNEDNERHINEEYKAKVRSLRFNLEDKKNPLLCTRVLLGILSLSSLVDMTPEQLASKDLQETRARIEDESKQSHTIHPVVIINELSSQSKVLNQTSPAVGAAVDVESKQKSSIYYATEIHSESILNLEENVRLNKDSSHTASVENEYGIRIESRSATSVNSLGSTELNTAEAIEDSFPKKNDVVHNLLIIDSSSDEMGKSLLLGDEENSTNTKLPSLGRSGNLVMSISGTRDYLFTIKAMKISFSAGFFWDKNLSVPFQTVSNLLPHELVDKGRVAIEEFNNFISAKTKSKKWEMVPLKLVNIHDEDEANYKAFYKEYESIRRIAMFRVSDDIHLYLVTPKFIYVAHCLREIIVNNKPCTYAVLLIKRSA